MSPSTLMQFLALAERELRIAARKSGSYRLRMLTCGVGLSISGFSLWVVTLFGERAISGPQLFFALSWASFVCACVVGPALTADSVNEERASGTLGLLFLTNLNSFSIVLGKLAGHGLLALYSLFSVIPVLALPALLGGADAEALAKTGLVLVVTVVLSLVIGMLCSTLWRKPWAAGLAALCALAFLALGIPAGLFLFLLNPRAEWMWIRWIQLLSPTYALSMAMPAASSMLPSNDLWRALLAQMALALVGLAGITFLMPRIWRVGESRWRTRPIHKGWCYLKYGSAAGRRLLRTRLLEVSPFLWLASRQRFGSTGLGLLVLMVAHVIAQAGQKLSLGPSLDDFLRPMIVWIVTLPLLYLAFCFHLAAAASERFSADRKTGAIELILCTPLKVSEIIRGHWLGLIRRFWGAALILLCWHAFALNYIIEATRIEGRMPGFNAGEIIAGSFRHVFGAAHIPNEAAPFYIACLAVLTAASLIVVLWIALVWVSMALSLKLRREIFAPWLALFLLAVPPLPLIVLTVAFLDNKNLFASNLFLAMLRVGVSEFFVVLVNALFWLLLARRLTYRILEKRSVL